MILGSFAEAAKVEPILGLSSILLGDLRCVGEEGFNFFDPDTEFISYCVALLIGSTTSLSLVGPVLYRILELSRSEKGQLTIFGQLATIGASIVPVLYLTSFWMLETIPSVLECFVALFGGIVATLHRVQDGRVSVCSPEVQLYWFGIIGAYLILASDSYLRLGLMNSWPLIAASALSITVFILELHNPSRGQEDVVAFDDITIFGKITMKYLNNLLEKGSTEKLTHDDLPKVPSSLNVMNYYMKLQHCLGVFPTNARWRLLRSLLSMLKVRVAFLMVVQCVGDIVTYTSPSILGLFLSSLTKYSNSAGPLFNCVYFAILLGLIPLISSGLQNLAYLISNHIYVASRVSLIATVYRKSLELGPKAREEFDSAKVMNLINVDTAQINSAALVLPTLVSAPVAIMLSTYQLWVFIGPSMFISLVFYIICVPTTGWLSALIGKLYPQIMVIKDERNKYTSNTFRNIKSLKLYAWESPFYERIVDARRRETQVQRKVAVVGLFMKPYRGEISRIVEK